MKTALLAALLFVSSSAHAFDEWSSADTTREAIYLTLHAIDWAQTRNIARNPDRNYEFNPIIGEHPTVGRVDGYMATSAALHLGITTLLPSEYRSTFQYFTIAFKSGLVYHNFSVGINAKF